MKVKIIRDANMQTMSVRELAGKQFIGWGRDGHKYFVSLMPESLSVGILRIGDTGHLTCGKSVKETGFKGYQTLIDNVESLWPDGQWHWFNSSQELYRWLGE